MGQPIADLKDCENRAAEKQSRWLILLWSAKTKLVVKWPPSPGDIHWCNPPSTAVFAIP
jgi:hypothetical protein